VTIDRILVFIVVGLTALLIGGMVGLWAGAKSEQNTFLAMLARGKFTDDCKEQITRAMQGGGEAPAAPSQ
jgi:hypothetical protein